jgi:hypothetical protein
VAGFDKFMVFFNYFLATFAKREENQEELSRRGEKNTKNLTTEFTEEHRVLW